MSVQAFALAVTAADQKVSQQIKLFKELLRDYPEAGHESATYDEDEFAAIIRMALLSGIFAEDICKRWGINRPGLRRWTIGKSPQPEAHGLIVSWIRDQLVESVTA